MGEPPTWRPERYLAVLRLLARQLYLHLDPRLRRRFDSSDIVQDTLKRSLEHLSTFRGTTEAEFIRWLKTILDNTLADRVDWETSQKRDPGRERPLGDIVAESSARLEEFLQARQPSPSEIAERHELFLRFAEAVGRLPDDQRDVSILHFLHQTPVGQIAAQLGRSEKSVAGLLYRAKRSLAEAMADQR